MNSFCDCFNSGYFFLNINSMKLLLVSLKQEDILQQGERDLLFFLWALLELPLLIKKSALEVIKR